MVDRDRVLAKLDELDGYLGELRSITPRDLEEYARIEKKRGSASGSREKKTTSSRSWRAEASSRKG